MERILPRRTFELNRRVSKRGGHVVRRHVVEQVPADERSPPGAAGKAGDTGWMAGMDAGTSPKDIGPKRFEPILFEIHGGVFARAHDSPFHVLQTAPGPQS